MKTYNICRDCFKAKYGKDLKLATNVEYAEFRTTGFESTVCPVCGSSNTQKLFGLDATFVRGYGLADKKSVANDIHLSTLQSNDPYERDKADKDDLTLKLNKKKEYNKKPKSYRM